MPASHVGMCKKKKKKTPQITSFDQRYTQRCLGLVCLQISMPLNMAFGRDTEGGQWTLSYLTDKLLHNLLTWSSEPRLIEDTLELLVAMVEKKDRWEILLPNMIIALLEIYWCNSGELNLFILHCYVPLSMVGDSWNKLFKQIKMLMSNACEFAPGVITWQNALVCGSLQRISQPINSSTNPCLHQRGGCYARP